jgi:uncharacterized protein (TIGR02300 family)
LSQGSTLKALSTSAPRGLKQTCGNEDCSRRFYDLNRAPPVACPYCGTPYDAAVVFRHEFVKVVGQRKGKTYRLEEPPVRKIEEDVAEEEIVTEEDDGAVSTPDVLIDIEDEDEASTEDVLGRETSGEGAA